MLLTQNVDRLHQAAGSRVVIDLHGRLDLVRCLACAAALHRADFQDDLIRLNAAWAELDAAACRMATPSSTIWTSPASPYRMRVLRRRPEAGRRVLRRKRSAGSGRAGHGALEAADAMLVVGSSLMVYSGFRFAQAAARSAYRSPPSISAGHVPTICLT